MTDEREEQRPETAENNPADAEASPSAAPEPDWQGPETRPKEVGGKRGPEPTRYGDWESNGRCTDF